MSFGGRSLPPLSVSLQGDGSDFDSMLDGASNSITSFENSARMAFSGFNDAIVHAGSIMENVTSDIQRNMEDLAIQQSNTSRHSSTQLAQAYYELASTGRDVASVMASMPAIDHFAIAGRLDMVKATNLAASAQTALGLRSKSAAEDAKNLTRVTDVLTEAANFAQGSVQDFAVALTSRAAGGLRQMNKSIEEGTAVLAAYANQGITAYKGGWLLNTMLRELAQAAIRKKDAWKSATLSLYDGNEKMKNMADIVAMFENKLKGMTDQTKMATLNQLGFNGELLNAMLPLLGLSGSIRDFQHRLEGAGGAVEEVYEKQMKSFAAQGQRMINILTNIKIEIERSLAPSMMKLNDMIIEAGLYWWKLSEQTKEWVAWGVKAGAMATAVAFAVGALVFQLGLLSFAAQQAWPVITGGLRLMRAAAMMALAPLAPYLLIVAAIAAVVAGIAYFIIGPAGIAKGWEIATEYVKNFANSVMGFFANFAENMTALSTWFVANWKNMFLDAGEILIRFAGAQVQNWMVYYQTLIRLTTAFIGWLTKALPAAWKYVMSDQFQLAVLEGLGYVMESYQSWFNDVIVAFGTYGKTIYDVLLQTSLSVARMTINIAIESAKVMADIATGNIPNLTRLGLVAATEAAKAADAIATAAAPLAANLAQKYQDASEFLKKDFDAGAGDLNFFNTAGDILKEQAGKLTTGLEDFKARTSALPELNFKLNESKIPGLPDTTDAENAAQDAADLVDEMAKQKEELAKPVVIKVSGDFDALEQGTAAEFDFLANYAGTLGQSYVGQTAAAVAEGPGNTFSYSGDATSVDNDILKEIEKNTRTPRDKVEISNADLASARGLA